MFLFGFLTLWSVVHTEVTQIRLADSGEEWNLNVLPNPNSTGHLVFDTISSLLQHWPNTRYHSGHNIVPGIIPTGTLFYHGRGDPHTPTTSEWVATDPEFARLFCDSTDVPCFMHTLVATRPLRVLYFDGSSATKQPDGPIDTQDILTWGAVLPERQTVEWDYKRMHRLCDFGHMLGIDAYVRMQLNFEIMICNFTDGVEITTLSRLQDEPRFPDYAYSFAHSSEWHDAYPGETRIQLDLTHLISLYDVALAPSLISHRVGRDRRAHRVFGIDKRDTEAVIARVRAMSWSPSQSGIDWRTLFQAIRDRYATRLEVLQSTLNATDEDDAARRAFGSLLTTLMPYRLHSAVPPPVGSGNAWAAPVFRLCAETHTSFIGSRESTLTASEKLLLNAARETSREICRTLVGMWAAGALELRSSAKIPGSLVAKWKSEVGRLMDWLGWSVWVKCRPACASEESCHLPGAPFSMEKWNVTEPLCVRLFLPYSGWPDIP
ncbi:hypothetical protein DFH07DRAFT_848133 [Mycena maculata]|uniref:Uncharacterized protein n=1 Tax=Mycena maculata TaxID=230809 RepID=A0AAD7MSK7_9AGAR|nr:hypothetical protein DFH07DRAFT_848133 [Mycena maculata]